MRLLVAEDDPKLLKSLVHLFEINHYLVDGVDNGSDALEYALSGEYDGLVFDIMMPEIDGWALTREIRKISDIPIIMLWVIIFLTMKREKELLRRIISKSRK